MEGVAMYYITYSRLVFLALVFMGSNCLAMLRSVDAEKLLDKAKSSVGSAQNILNQAQGALDRIVITDGKIDVSDVVPDEQIKEAIDFFNENPEVLEILKEAAFGRSSWKTKLAQLFTSIPAHILHQCKGFFLGIAVAGLAGLSMNALYPDTLCQSAPQGAFACAMIGLFSVIAAKLYGMLSIPESFDQILLHRAFNIATRLAPLCVTDNNDESVTTQITPTLQKSFKDFVSTLTQNQKRKLSAPYILLQAQIDARILFDEIPFLDCLTSEQVASLFVYLHNSFPASAYENFDEFAHGLTTDQLSYLDPDNKILLASFNPKLLLTDNNTEFLATLSSSQTDELSSLL